MIVRYHSADLWGEYIQFWVWGGLTLLLLSFGSRDFLLKAFSTNPRNIFPIWKSNTKSRLLLLIPVYVVLYFAPLDRGLKLVLMIWLFTHFINNSFQVLVLYKKYFRASVQIEVMSVLVLIPSVLWFKDLTVLHLFMLVTLASLVKTISYFFIFYSDLIHKNAANYRRQFFDSLPYFLPLVAGVVQVRIDLYFSTVLLSPAELALYQVLISLFGMSSLVATFVISPYIKVLFRVPERTHSLLIKRAYFISFIISIIISLSSFFILTYLYRFEFSPFVLVLGALFMIPVFPHILLINGFYRMDRQKLVAGISIIVILFQGAIGYTAISTFNIMGALMVKVLGFWFVILCLHFVKKRTTLPENNKIV